MDEREKSHCKNASTSQDSLKMEIIEDGNWMNVKTIQQDEPIAHSSTLDKNDKDAVISYSTNREKVYHKNAGTIEEIHVLESSGRTTRDFAEEHWSSEIKSYVMPEPPKFIQVIKAFRVLATDTLTLVVEVQSDPPAIFEWFCNDRPIQQNRRKFKARHGINITTLTVEGPEQGVYKCTARNPVGISTTYGYVTVNAPPSYKTWLEQTHEVNEEMNMEIIDKENIQTSTDIPPKFIQQIPNLTLRPGTEALIDVEVEASPPAKFTWYVNGVQFRDTVGQIEVYYPVANRCIARFPIPQKGEYKVIAENRAGKEHSIGYIDIKNEVMHHQTQLPPLPNDHIYHHSSYAESEHRDIPLLQGRGRASSVSRIIDYYEESSYYQRSTSLPRQIDYPYEIKKTTEIIRKRKDDSEQLQQQQQQQQQQQRKEEQHREQQYLSLKEFVETKEEQLLQPIKRRRYSETTQHLLPQKPIFTSKLPVEIAIGSDDDLVLNVDFKAIPRADVKWNVNGFELKDSKKVTIVNENDHSTLTVRSPIRYGRYNVTIMNEYGMSNQSTRVHYDVNREDEKMTKEQSYHLELNKQPIAATITTTGLVDGWELIDEQQRSSKSADSFETVKYVETVRAATEGYETPTPTPRDEAFASRQSFHSSTYNVRQNEEIIDGRSTINYETSKIPPQLLPKPITPIIHEPLERVNVSEISHASPYTEKRYEEVTSGISKIIYETPQALLLPSKFTEPMLDTTTFTEQKYEKVNGMENGYEIINDNVSSTKTKLQNEIDIEKKTFRIPVPRVPEPIPKYPFILKQPKPEIRLKAGEKLVLESKVESSPPSQFKWYQNNFEVRPSSSIILESPAVNESRATFLKPISGTYKMVASNIHGSCSSTTRVITEVTEEWITESTVSVIRSVPEKLESKYQLVKRSHKGTRDDLPKAPRIVEAFAPILKIANNEPLMLRVTADAIPEAEFRWMLNNFEVRPSQTVTVERLGVNISQATFHNPISGRYEVVATNLLGQDSCSGKVIVDYAEEAQIAPIQPIVRPVIPKIPVFIKALPGETQLYPDEQEFRLSVSVHGEQPITFRWFADGSLLSNSVEHQMINDLENSTLVVRKQTVCDVDYAVEVSNTYGAVWSETTVRPPSPTTSFTASSATSVESSLAEVNDTQPSSPRYTIILADKDLQQNDEFTAHVAINVESSPCEFFWTLNGRDIRTIPGFHIESTFYESTIYIKSMLSKHSGELSVVASNKYGTARSTAKIIVHPLREKSYEFISEIETIPAERPPRIVLPLRPFVFRAGESLELRCRVDGLPRPEVFWTKDGIRVDDGMVEKELITLQYPDGRHELINPHCEPEDAGLYQLTARNIHGSTNTSAYIHVERRETVETTTTETRSEIQEVIHRGVSKPRFSNVISKQYEDDMIVSCKVISETPVVISWFKDGQRLYQTYKYRMQKLSDNTYTLTICNVDKWDEGSYTCRAENTYGSSETSMFIRPLVKTREISEEILVEENDSEVIGLQDNIGYVKKRYTDTTVKVSVEPEVSGSQEVYSHTAELRKTEAEYKLLVKVAEIVASKLVAKVIIDEAINVALRRMNVVAIESSEEEEFESISEQQPCPPRFETNIECYTVDIGDAVVLHTDISGYPQPNVEWYFGEQKLEQSEQIEVKYVNQQAILTIKNVQKKHEGTYYCHAENDYGKTVLPCNLRVTDTAIDWSESTHKMIRSPLIYTLTETETEVSSNVHVTHAAECYDHYFSTIQPETFALGYSCLASTSKIHDDSVIITRESMQKMIEREQEVTEVMLNVNVERTPSVFKHDARILRSTDESVTICRREPQSTRAEEVIQTNDILLIGDQRVLKQHQSVVNAITTVVFEKPSQRALHEITCLYDDKAYVSKEKVQAVSTIDLKRIEIVNELISTIMATEEKFREAYAEANVDVRCPDAIFDHFIKIIESEQENLSIHLIAPILVKNLVTSDFHLQQKSESLHAESIFIEYPRKNATAEQRIVILQSSFQKFSEAITWNLKKISKETTEDDITVAHATIKVYKPEEIGEYVTTVVDTRRMVPELLAIAAAASKLKLTSVFVTFTKKGDVAHQALVIEYESFVEDEATLNVAMLTAPGFHSKQESIWSYEKKYEKSEETEANVIAVFVEVNATCPNQMIELIASVSLPPTVHDITDVTQPLQPLEPSSISWSESSSTGLFQVPKFIKTLENTTAIVGQCHQFKCIVSGTPAPVIRWYVDGDVIHNSGIYQIIYEDGVCILKIREVAIEDEGEYTCEATNDAGQAITKCFLQTITEADVLKYQQQSIIENIAYSNNGRNNNNKNDNCAFVDNISSSSNIDGIVYQNRSDSCNSLVEMNSNHRKQFLIVNYEFARNEPVSAETAVIVTRYIAPQKGLLTNLASEERSFNISVFLPDAAMKCDFIWALINCATVALHLKLSHQANDFIIQNFLSQQTEEAYLLLSVRKLTFENVYFAIYQPWEEILLLKKSENAFTWDIEFCRSQKLRLEMSIKNSTENICGRNELMENIAVQMLADTVEENDATNLLQMKESVNELKVAINEGNIRSKDEEEKESGIPIIPEKITCKKEKDDDDDISLNDDNNQFKHELFRHTSEASETYPGISTKTLATIQRYVDELFDFDSAVPTISTDTNIYKQNDINKLDTTSDQMENDPFKDFASDDYLNYSFCHKLDYVEAVQDLPIAELTSANSHLVENVMLSSCLNSNPNFKNMVLSKESIEPMVTRSLTCEVGYNSDDNSRQNLSNCESKGDYTKLDTCNSLNTLDNIQLHSHLTTETYPLYFTSSIESTDAAATFDASEEFDVFTASTNPRLQHNESYSTSLPMPISECNHCVLEDDHTKFSTVNPEVVDGSTSKITGKESLSTHSPATNELLSKIKVIDEVCREIENEIEMKTEDNEEVLQIERAIYDISERIEHQQSVTEAQAEASEELLKTILENIIKNIGQNSITKTMAAYKRPVVLLREKLTDLEETLKREELEFNESSMRRSIPEVHSRFSKSFSAEDEHVKSIEECSIEREIRGVSLCALQQIGSINKQEIRKMTPLTSNIKEQLQSLECMLGEVEEEAEDEEGMKELNDADTAAAAATAGAEAIFPVYTDTKQHEVHNILMQINNEISIIKRCCQRNISKTSIDAAVGLLHKVRNNVSSMTDLILVYRKRLGKKSSIEKGLNVSREGMKSSKRSTHHLSPYSRTGFFFKTDASVNLYFVKREESEVINAIVKLLSLSDKYGKQLSKSENSQISTYDNAIFDDKNKTLEEIKIDPLWTAVSESTINKDDEVFSSNSIDPQANSFSRHSTQEAIPVRPPRKSKEMSQQGVSSPLSPPPIPPFRVKKHRSKSCDNYENFLIRSSSSDMPNYHPMPVNMQTEDEEVSQFYVGDCLKLMNDLSVSIPKQKSQIFDERIINYEGIVRKENSFYNCSYIWPSKEAYHILLEIFDESNSIQLLCEDSDYAPESVMHSLLLFESTDKTGEELDGTLLQTLEDLSDMNISKAETITENDAKLDENFTVLEDEKISTTFKLDENYNENTSKYQVCLDRNTNENSKSIDNLRSSTSENALFESIQKPTQHSHIFMDTKAHESTVINPLEDEANSLHEIESIDDKDEILDELDDLMIICNPHASIIDGIDLLPTIMEDSEHPKLANSFMSVSTNTVIANIDMKDVLNNDIEDEESDITVTSTLESTITGLNDRITQNLLNKYDEDDVNYLDNYKRRVIVICESDAEQISDEITINVRYKKPSNKLKVIAILSPEIGAKAEAYMVIGEDFDVLVEQPDEVQNITVNILDHISDSISLDLMLPNTVEVDLSLKRCEQYEGILSYQIENLIDSGTDEERISMISDNDHYHHSSKATGDKEQRTGILVNIIARSMHDIARASLEEIPWGEVSMYIVMQPIMTRSKTDSETRNSVIQNVTVSESNETEKRSLHSHESVCSLSQQSFDWSEFGDRNTGGQNFNIPSYVVREGSTATITCEFNNFLAPGSVIDWFKGKNLMQIIPGKTDRISHDLLEVLVISHVNLMDGDIYSIRVNDMIYPVAYLIIENANTASFEKLNDDNVHFISPPQTLFVMEGQPSIISCQVNSVDQKIEWCKDNKKWITENERIRLEADQFGFHRLIIDKSELDDQGTYYAFLGDHFTTVTLVVEERIDEREVTISALGTDTEEDDYREYLVPLGSTATIACELENTDEVQELIWRKDGKQIEFTDDGKVEHVVNGLKHYLVIHDTEADDSASYSISINNMEFKIAHLLVSNYATPIGSKYTKREYSSQITVEESLVPIGSAATIHCETITQQYSLDWRKNLRPIVQDERIERKDTADGFEHSLTIYSVRKSDEGEYGVVIKDSYTAVTKITVIESQGQISTEHFDISLHPTTTTTINEGYPQLHDVISLQQAQTMESYQLCNMEEYFDLRFSMQSYEIPVIVNEKRLISISYLSHQLSIQSVDNEFHIHREPSYAISNDLTFMEVTMIECNFVTTNVHFQFTSSTSISYALAEAVVLTLIAQQSAYIHLSSQFTQLTTSFIKSLDVRELTVVTNVQEKIVKKLGIKLDDRWVKLDVILLSPMQNIAMDITNKIPRMIALEMDFIALIFEKYSEIITFNKTSECEFADAVMLTKSIIYPEKITRQFTMNVVWLEFIAIYKVPQIFDTTIRINVTQREIIHLQCDASKANTIDEIFTVCGPIQQQNIAVTVPEILFSSTNANYIDSMSSLELILMSHMDENLLVTKEVPLIRMEMISMQLMASVLEVIPVTYSFSKAENMEMRIFVKPHMSSYACQRDFVDSVTKLEMELWSQIKCDICVNVNFRTREIERLSTTFSGSTAEYFDLSTAFNIQPEIDTVTATLLTTAPKITEKAFGLFSDATISEILEYSSQVRREFYADAIFLISRKDIHTANFRASTFENLHVIISFEVQSQESNTTMALLKRAPIIVDRASVVFSDDFIEETVELRSQNMHNLEVEMGIFTARKDNLFKNIKGVEFEEKNIVAIIEVQPEKEDLEFILLTPISALVEQISRSFSDSVVNLITELHVQSDFHTYNNIMVARICALQMFLKASEEENITVIAKFCVQDEIENIMATLLTQIPAVTERIDRKFSDRLMKFVVELWSKIRREAFADAKIYIARNDELQMQLKASSIEETHASIVLEEYPKVQELEVTLLEFVRADIYKLNRFFSYKTVNLIATLWCQTQSSYANINIPIKRNDNNQICLQASTEECLSILTSFEVLPQQRDDYFEVLIAMHEIAEAWIEATKEENFDIERSFDVESEAHCAASLLIVQKEKQLINVQASSIENIEIYTSFEICPEEEIAWITITLEQITAITEKRYSDEITKLDIEIYYDAVNHETVKVDLIESKLSVWKSSYKIYNDRSLCLFASEFIEEINNTTYEYIMQQFEENIRIMIELSRNPTIQSCQIDLQNIFQSRQAMEENEMNRLWSRTQLNVGFYQHLDLTRSAQTSDSAFILRKNIYEEDESADELSTSSSIQAAPQFAEKLSEIYEIEEFSTHLFKCIIYGTPAPQVRWYRNEQAIIPSDNITEIAEDGIYILKINNIDRSWNGNLVCEAENAIGIARTHSIIHVQRSEESSSISSASIGGQMPIIHLLLDSEINAKKGENIQLKCIISGSPLPSVQWKRNDVIIENNEHYLTICDDGICILRILNVTEEDNAIFSCTAMNMFGSAKTKSRVIVEEEAHLASTSNIKEEESPTARSSIDDHTIGEISMSSMSSQDSLTTQFQIPQFTLPLHDITIENRGELQLKCIVTGEPMPTIRWSCNGKEIQADNRWKVLISIYLINYHPLLSYLLF
uniref:Bm6219, isoform k n=1 Tax=Brugia malayi TaxID=6279 RepID=A0A1I9G842_BRUMA|nr:Bm6219, isoform k [Brugia malayi]